MCTPPKSPLGLLQNLKVALDRNLLFEESFCGERSLSVFSGAQRIKGAQVRAGHERYYLLDFDAVVAPRQINGSAHPAIQYQISKKYDEPGKLRVTGHLYFGVACDSLNFEAVLDIFGTEWWYLPPRAPVPPGRVFHKPTHPHGNRTLHATSNGATWSQRLEIKLSANGNLRTLTFAVEQNDLPDSGGRESGSF
jgi:hypothetical protein